MADMLLSGLDAGREEEFTTEGAEVTEWDTEG
jgi:hypothetical protein